MFLTWRFCSQRRQRRYLGLVVSLFERISGYTYIAKHSKGFKQRSTKIQPTTVKCEQATAVTQTETNRNVRWLEFGQSRTQQPVATEAIQTTRGASWRCCQIENETRITSWTRVRPNRHMHLVMHVQRSCMHCFVQKQTADQSHAHLMHRHRPRLGATRHLSPIGDSFV